MSGDGFSGANKVFIPAEYHAAALAAILVLAEERADQKDPNGYSLAMPELQEATTLRAALWALGWEIREDATGNVTHLVYTNHHIGSVFTNLPYMEAIAPYVDDGSFVDLYSVWDAASAQKWRLIFANGFAELRDAGAIPGFDAWRERERPQWADDGNRA